MSYILYCWVFLIAWALYYRLSLICCWLSFFLVPCTQVVCNFDFQQCLWKVEFVHNCSYDVWLTPISWSLPVFLWPGKLHSCNSQGWFESYRPQPQLLFCLFPPIDISSYMQQDGTWYLWSFHPECLDIPRIPFGLWEALGLRHWAIGMQLVKSYKWAMLESHQRSTLGSVFCFHSTCCAAYSFQYPPSLHSKAQESNLAFINEDAFWPDFPTYFLMQCSQISQRISCCNVAAKLIGMNQYDCCVGGWRFYFVLPLGCSFATPC